MAARVGILLGNGLKQSGAAVIVCNRRSAGSVVSEAACMLEAPEKSTAPLAPHRPLDEFYAEPTVRGQFVNQLFDQAAPDYDWVSGVMSLWTDRYYRKRALRRAGLQPGMRLLDVACGTGLMTRAALELGVEPKHVTGLDPSRGMLNRNRERNPVDLLQGRGEALPLRDATFDFVCLGYALRHTEDLRRLFGELRRVLRPGGRLLILEITRPTSPAALGALRVYLQRIMPVLGWMRRRNKSTARLLEYYWATIDECVPPTVILSTLRTEGFHKLRRTTVGPLLSDYVAWR